MKFDKAQRPARSGLPLLLVVATLTLGACTSSGSAYSGGFRRATVGGEPGAVPAIREVPDWLRELKLVAPPGARREDVPGEAPYFWRGAPVELVARTREDVVGWLHVVWRDLDAVEVSRQQVTIRPGYPGGREAGEEIRFPAPPPRRLSAGGYVVEVRWISPDPQISPPGDARLSFGIGDRPADAAPGDDTPAFPWPPPRPTSRHLLPGTTLGGGAAPGNLEAVAERLLAALDATGYSEHSFFALRPDPAAPSDGFALVTRLEQILPDGTPQTEPDRWSAELPARDLFSLSGILDALFRAPEGHYRVIVFVVTGAPVVPSDEAPSRHDAGEWLGSGMARLPRSLGLLPWTADHACTALVYQFRQVGAGSDPEPHPPGAPSARDHLSRTGFLDALEP